ncbi:hypothetical protein JM93_03557 [Roseibium hamelinense]|uniref:CheA signal transduction histidine kinase n=1 Tax=Roseibium hamelinense TaxID=150831 RepID=A0A562SLL3_9HYPH|nr:hypothetical protein [Roseibium hamelinense]MTI44950.1 hypothetical protein [Roseibium hamelinense]TWI82211.1 hypothetical protein JM93_03557 [Roseibium hamelinense]
MADYYSILKKTITALPENNGAARRGVYSRARTAIVNQLKAYEPPLSPSEITAEQLRLEEAIRKVEAEAARAALGLDPVAKATAPATANGQQASQTTEIASSNPAVTPETADTTAKKSDEKPAEGGEPTVAPPAVNPLPTSETSTPSPLKETVEKAEKLGQASHQAVVSSKQDFEEQPVDIGPSERQEPVVGSVYSEFDETDQAFEKHDQSYDEPTLAAPAAGNGATSKRKRYSSRGAKSASDALTGGGGRSATSMLLMAVLVLIGFSIIGVVYSQRDMIAGLFAGSENEVASVTPGESAPAEPEQVDVSQPETVNGSAKNNDRLLDADGEPAAAPDARSVTTTLITPQDIETLTGQSSPGAEQIEAPSETPAVSAEEDRVPQQPETDVAALPGNPDDLSGATDTPAIIGTQRAILYEEGEEANGSGTASNGNVVWSLEKETDVQGREQQVLSAAVSIPERSLSANIRIKPNDDSSLPASHLVEIKYEFPEEFSSGDVVNVPGLVMKPTEEARGDALLGASVKVSPGYFWIALSSLSSERERNMGLLSDRGWIDIPMLFDTGKRGILTIEKGDSGKQVVDQAVAAWQAG